MKALIVALALLLVSPLAVLGGDQVIPNGIQRVGAPVANDMSTDVKDVNVAVVDTGIDTAHPDLNVVGGVDCSPKVNLQLPFAAHTFVTQDVKDAANPFGPITIDPSAPGYQDGMGHGTHVSGIIGALDNDLGVVGVAPGVNLYAVRVLDESGSGTPDSLLCGLEWIVRNNDRLHIDVVNMSLGFHFEGETVPLFAPCHTTFPNNPLFMQDPDILAIQEAICNITDLGIPVVVAAGNDDGSASMNFPATLENVITVSNFSDFDGKPGGFAENVACPELGGWDDTLWTHWNNTPDRDMSSSNGIDVDISAPGTCILSTLPGPWGRNGGAYGTATGTSMATPHVTGLIALYKASCPDASIQDVRNWLRSSAEAQTKSFGDTDTSPEPLARYGKPECA